MTKSHVVLVVGTRPEVIKMAPVYRQLQGSDSLQPILLSTGQHRQLLDQALNAFGLTPDYDLGLMQSGQSLPELTGRVVNAISGFILKHRPDALLAQGDTTTVMASAIAAAYEKVPVGHVEAGLRTYDMDHPFPEEMNRRMVSPLARWSFVPTETNRDNLLSERIKADTIHVTGNTVIDALLWMREKVAASEEQVADIADRLGIETTFAETFLTRGGNQSLDDEKRLILVTGHRRESFGEGFENICKALLELAETYPDVGILYPVHWNPRVREPVKRLLANNPQIVLIEPVGYRDFIWLMDRSYFLLSDSGGVQEEAPSLGKPVLVMRTTTERPEGVAAGTCRLVGTDPEAISREARILLTDSDAYRHRACLQNPYGDGTAARKIRAVLERDLNEDCRSAWRRPVDC